MSASKGMFNRFDDVFVLDGVRTPMVDHLGAFADANPIDLGIKVAKAVFERTGVAPAEVDSVLAGNMAPGGFDQFYVPRHIGLYAGVPFDYFLYDSSKLGQVRNFGCHLNRLATAAGDLVLGQLPARLARCDFLQCLD